MDSTHPLAHSVAERCRRVLQLAEAVLPEEYGYPCLPYCVIDAVYSIGVRYEGVRNVIARYRAHLGFAGAAAGGSAAAREEAEHSLQALLADMRSRGVEPYAREVFRNLQRTSARNGILKAEAVYRFASVLARHGADLLPDVARVAGRPEFEAEARAIPGQGSGLSLRYFYMLCGADDVIKPDRMVLRFLQETTGRSFTPEEAQRILAETAALLRSEYPSLTPRSLDHEIWQYQRLRKPTPATRGPRG